MGNRETMGPLLVSYDCDGDDDGESFECDDSVVRVWSLDGIEDGAVNEMVARVDVSHTDQIILTAIGFGGQTSCLAIVHAKFEVNGPTPKLLKIWNLGSSDVRFSVDISGESFTSGPNLLLFNHSGEQILVRLLYGGYGLFDSQTGLPILTCFLPCANEFCFSEPADFSSDDTRLIFINTKKKPVVWNLQSGEHILLSKGPCHRLRSHPTSCICAAVGGSIHQSSGIYIWNWSSQSLLTAVDPDDVGFVSDLQFGSGEDTIITRGPQALRVWNYSDFSCITMICSIAIDIDCFQVNRLNNTIVAVDRSRQSVCIFDAVTGAKLCESRKQRDRLYESIYCPTSQVVLL